MNENELEIFISVRVDQLIKDGYIDPTRREEIERKMFEAKKRETEVSL